MGWTFIYYSGHYQNWASPYQSDAELVSDMTNDKLTGEGACKHSDLAGAEQQLFL